MIFQGMPAATCGKHDARVRETYIFGANDLVILLFFKNPSW